MSVGRTLEESITRETAQLEARVRDRKTFDAMVHAHQQRFQNRQVFTTLTDLYVASVLERVRDPDRAAVVLDWNGGNGNLLQRTRRAQHLLGERPAGEALWDILAPVLDAPARAAVLRGVPPWLTVRGFQRILIAAAHRAYRSYRTAGVQLDAHYQHLITVANREGKSYVPHQDLITADLHLFDTLRGKYLSFVHAEVGDPIRADAVLHHHPDRTIRRLFPRGVSGDAHEGLIALLDGLLGAKNRRRLLERKGTYHSLSSFEHQVVHGALEKFGSYNHAAVVLGIAPGEAHAIHTTQAVEWFAVPPPLVTMRDYRNWYSWVVGHDLPPATAARCLRTNMYIVEARIADAERILDQNGNHRKLGKSFKVWATEVFAKSPWRSQVDRVLSSQAGIRDASDIYLVTVRNWLEHYPLAGRALGFTAHAVCQRYHTTTDRYTQQRKPVPKI